MAAQPNSSSHPPATLILPSPFLNPVTPNVATSEDQHKGSKEKEVVPPSSTSALTVTSSSSIPVPSSLVTSADHYNGSKKIEAKEGGIDLDEKLTGLSSTSIPPKISINLKGKDVSQIMVHSLPSSPSKGPIRGIDFLRADLQKLKDEELPKIRPKHLHEDGGLSKEEDFEGGKVKGTVEGKSFNFIHLIPKDGNSELSALQSDSPLMKDHVILPSPSKHASKPHYPDHKELLVKSSYQIDLPGYNPPISPIHRAQECSIN